MSLLIGWLLLLGGQVPAPPDDAVTRAFRDLYKVAVSLTADPSDGYEADLPNNQWPYAADVKRQWNRAVTANGTSLTAMERDRIVPCAAHLINAINTMEEGYTLAVKQKGNAPAQRSAEALYVKGRKEFAQCDEAYALGQTNTPRLTGGVEQSEPAPPAASTPLAGSAEEAAQPGSVDWTAALDPLFKWMGSEWQRETVQWKYAADNEPNMVTMVVRPNQPPQYSASSGSKRSILDDIVQRAPPVRFPPGSQLRAIELVNTFYLGTAPTRNSPTDKLRRTRLRYYERNGVFKSYPVIVPN